MVDRCLRDASELERYIGIEEAGGQEVLRLSDGSVEVFRRGRLVGSAHIVSLDELGACWVCRARKH